MKFGEVLVDKKRLTELTGISERTAQRRIKNGDFEEPVHFVRSGVGRTAKYLYRVELIQDWLANCRVNPEAHRDTCQKFLLSLPSSTVAKRGRPPAVKPSIAA